MVFNFSKLLTTAQLIRLAAVRREVERLYGLPDRWLAEELLRLARACRQRYPEKLADPFGITYDPNFVWHLVPEIAKRLGATRILPNEARRYAGLSPSDLRQCIGVYLQNSVIDNWDNNRMTAEKPSPEELLLHQVQNGNPVAFAMDRICAAPPKGEDRDDLTARLVREISRVRGLDETPHWSPALSMNTR